MAATGSLGTRHVDPPRAGVGDQQLGHGLLEGMGEGRRKYAAEPLDHPVAGGGGPRKSGRGGPPPAED